MAGSPVEALNEALSGGTPSAPQSEAAGQPATTDSTQAFVEANLASAPDQPARYGPTKFTDLAKSASDARKMPDEERALTGQPPAEESEENGPSQGEAGAPPEPEPGLVPLDHPQFGRIYVSQAQANDILNRAFQPPQQQFSPQQQNQFAYERQKLDAQAKKIEADTQLTDAEKDSKLSRIEVKQLRLDQQEARAFQQFQYESYDHQQRTDRGVAEADAVIDKNADVFDEAKALPGMPDELRKEFAQHAYSVAVSEMRNPANKHLTEGQVIEMVANNMRRLSKVMGLSKRETIKQFVQQKRVGTSPGAAPSTRGGGRAPDQGPNPDLRSGLGRAMIAKALEG